MTSTASHGWGWKYALAASLGFAVFAFGVFFAGTVWLAGRLGLDVDREIYDLLGRFAVDILDPRGDLRPCGPLAHRGDVAVTEPVRSAVGTGAVQHDVGRVDPLLTVGRPHEQPERLPARRPADVQHGVFEVETFEERLGLAERDEVGVAELAAGD